MAFWVVYQGDSWRRARQGGYLWAPKADKNGGPPRFYWSNMERVVPGDLIFSGVANAVRAISEAAAPAYTAERPDPRDADHWYGEGWRLDVTYTDLAPPIAYSTWVPAVLDQMPASNSPFARTGRPNQGYLYEVPIAVGEYFLELAAANGVDAAGAAHSAAAGASTETERIRLDRARIGQGKFRDDLMSLWSSSCAVTGLSRTELLRASHVKPWAGSNNIERLDPLNGLLLSPTYDAAFDAFLISFTDEGQLILAADFSPAEAAAAGIDADAHLQRVPSGLSKYLATHRELMLARVARKKSGGGI